MQNLQQVDSHLKDYYDAFRDKNWAVFQDYLTDDFEYYTDGCTIQKKGEFVEFLSRTDWTVHSYSITNVRHIFSEKNDLVVVIYSIRFEGISAMKHLTLHATETMVMVETSQGLKIAHCHSSNE